MRNGEWKHGIDLRQAEEKKGEREEGEERARRNGESAIDSVSNKQFLAPRLANSSCYGNALPTTQFSVGKG